MPTMPRTDLSKTRGIGYCLLLALAALAVFAWAKLQVLPGLQGPVTFDGEHYLSIAQGGYHFDGILEHKQNISFLPLMALAIKAALLLLPGLNAILAVVVLGFVILFVTLLGIHRLTHALYGQDAARIATLLWACSPLAFYNFTGYADPLYAALAVWTLKFTLDKRYWWACLLAGMAVLARPQAVVLVGIVAVALWWSSRHDGWRIVFTKAPLQAMTMALPIFALATYFVYAFGDAAAYVNSMEAWRLGSFSDGNISSLAQIADLVKGASAAWPTLTLWTTLLTGVTLGFTLVLIALTPGNHPLVTSLFLGTLGFLMLMNAFSIINLARHVFFAVPWVILAGVAGTRAARTPTRQLLALTPWLAFCLVINIVAVGRYYTGQWVS